MGERLPTGERAGVRSIPKIVVGPGTGAFDNLPEQEPELAFTLRTFIEASLIVAKLAEFTNEVTPLSRIRAREQWETQLFQDLWQLRMLYEDKLRYCPPDKIDLFNVQLGEYKKLLADLKLAEEHNEQGEINQCQNAIARFESNYF